MRRDFVANVSHELKTPITVLSGFVETLADEEVVLTPTQRKRFLGLMAEQSQRMRHLIEDLLTLSALESVITSYSIHYTKLYEGPVHLGHP